MSDPTPMSPERLAEIDESVGEAHRDKWPAIPCRVFITTAIPELLAEVRRLEAGPGWADLRAARKLNDAGAKAIDALELIQESARERIAELEAGLREACDVIERLIRYVRAVDNVEDDPDWPDMQRLRALADGVQCDKEPHDPA